MSTASSTNPLPRPVGKVSFRLRLANSSDQQQLENLVRQSPMNGSMTLYYDRSPNFFSILERQGSAYKSYVAEINGEIIASISFAERSELWCGKRVQIVHASDLRIAPGYRGQKIARELLNLYVAEAQRPGIHHASCEILSGNEASIASLKTASDRLHTSVVTQAHLYQLLPLRYYRLAGRYTFRRATPADKAAVVSLLSEFHRTHDGSPIFDETYFDSFCNFSDFNIESFWLAELNQQPVALLAEWDQRSVRDLIVERYQHATAFLIWLGRLCAPLFGIHRPPRAGEALPYMYFRFPIHKPEHGLALQQLVRHRLNAIRTARSHLFVMMNFSSNDRLQKCLDGIPRLKSTALVYQSTTKPKALASSHRPHYVDFSIC